MRVLVTGAGGFIGARLVQVLRADRYLAGKEITQLAIADQRLGQVQAGEIAFEGDLGSEAILSRVAQFSPDVTFHLAAVPGGAAEANYALGRRVNLDTTLSLFESLAKPDTRPIVVYASSIAVYGATLPDPVTPQTALEPGLTYGAHKLACEILLADFTRRGALDGRSLRLPGIVARPKGPSGLASAFMSDLLHALKAGEHYTCPVSPNATAWWMSSWCCASNFVVAASADLANAGPSRAWPLPVLRLSIAEVVNAACSLFGEDRRKLVHYQPQPSLEATFGRYPRLDDALPRALGFLNDGTANELVRRALASHWSEA